MIDIKALVRKNILELKPYTSARSQYLKGTLLDANENAFGPVIENGDTELNRYPDPTQRKLREAIGKYLNINSKNIFCGVGSDEIIDLIVKIFCEPGKDAVTLFEPTYGMYKVVCDIQGVPTSSVDLTQNFQIDIEKFLKEKSKNTKVVFICSPNNPTANIINKSDILKIVKEFNGIVVVDQAYIDFYDESELLYELQLLPNLVLMRTFSKAWGLAGVRFGFAIADPLITQLLMNIKSPYNINKLTEKYVLNAITNIDRKNDILENIKNERRFLSDQLKQLRGIREVYKSDSNFILFKVDDADKVFLELAERKIIIRNRSNQKNLDECLRVTVGTREENNRFLRELSEIL